ncbi:MAG: hypothetical protein FWF33_01110 [Clostridiales bacterium]|nr:hypothetical protein [Clostridiales bacterium]
MKRISICIAGEERQYGERFARVVALDHPGFMLILREDCKDCREEADVCLSSVPGRPGCVKYVAFAKWDEEPASFPEPGREGQRQTRSPKIPKYAGASAILSAARRIALARDWEQNADRRTPDAAVGSLPPPVSGTFVCVYAFSGGIGTSAAAIGITREMARYRGKKALYLSLEEVESRAFAPPEHEGPMRAEAFLFHYLRFKRSGASAAELQGLMQAAFRQDSYGAYRLGPDAGVSSLSGLEPGKFAALLADIERALSIDLFVLDFGTRIRSLQMFLDLCEAFCVEVRSAERPGAAQDRLLAETAPAVFVNPSCPEDVRDDGRTIEVSIANAFGLAVKEVCDQIPGGEG